MARRNTFQRSTVLNAVRKLQNHATADEVYEEARIACPTISRTTVYRNLQQLCEMGEIRKREIPGSPDRYDHVTSDHYHVRCMICGKVDDVDMAYIPDLHQRIEDACGYEIDDHMITFAGTCPDCQAKERQGRVVC